MKRCTPGRMRDFHFMGTKGGGGYINTSKLYTCICNGRYDILHVYQSNMIHMHVVFFFFLLLQLHITAYLLLTFKQLKSYIRINIYVHVYTCTLNVETLYKSTTPIK